MKMSTYCLSGIEYSEGSGNSLARLYAEVRNY